ncbi:hypothetical protein PTTG_25877 [Puccinia triticina 1-1 BBBD Race 1]|uniref:Uncharacterized protein n=1 Tax=Puccinia triticina (isolate 1-1 / race 1 (BBBD)) TaxID=630390 RepID=A0A180H0R3_PUCT1|nr:hypothetical protein PTTG_25877 [Puccinia triticina 1-1 BBBD Race 1]
MSPRPTTGVALSLPHTSTFQQDRQPQPVTQADLAGLIEALRLQREDDQAHHLNYLARCEAENNQAQQPSFLDKELKIWSITGNAIKNFNNQNILKPVGSNVQEWMEALSVFVFQRFQDKFFFTPEEGKFINPFHKQIARSVLHSSVHSSLAYDLLDMNSSADAYDHLVSKFHIINRAKQIQAWETLKKINLSDYNSSTKAITAFDCCARIFVEQGIDFTWDTIISLIMQSNLHNHMQPSLDCKVDLLWRLMILRSPRLVMCSGFGTQLVWNVNLQMMAALANQWSQMWS